MDEQQVQMAAIDAFGNITQTLEAGMQVYPLNPKSAQAYRQRKAPSGVMQ